MSTGQKWFAFSGFRFNPVSGELISPDASVKLRPQTAQALALLVEEGGRVVDRETLRRRLWPDKRIVLFEMSIATVIRELRRALGDEAQSPRFIETLPRRGYRFVAPVTTVESASQADMRPRGVGFWRDPVHSLVRGGKLVAGLAVMLVFSGAVSIGPTRSTQLDPDSTVFIRVEPLEPFRDDPELRLLGRIVAQEVTTHVGAAAPSGMRVAMAEDTVGDAGQWWVGLPQSTFRLVGKVSRQNDSIGISARVVNADDGAQLWAARYGVDPDFGTSLAGRVAAVRIAGAVLREFVPAILPASEKPVPEAARSAYRQGVERLNRRTRDDARSARKLFRRAIGFAPFYARAHAGLAHALVTWPGPPKTTAIVEEARAAAQRALRLAPDNAEALYALGVIHLFHDWEWDQAGERFERAVRLAPDVATFRHGLASWLSARGRHRDALDQIELAYALDPASVAISIDVVLFRFFARDFTGAVQAARRMTVLWPENYTIARYAIWSHLAMGDVVAAARRAHRQLAQRGNEEGTRLFERASEAESVLDRYWTRTTQALESAPSAMAIDPLFLAAVYITLGRSAEALEETEAAAGERYFSYLAPYLGVNPVFDPLRGNRRFETALRSLGQAGLSDYYESGDFAGSDSP